MSGLGKARAAWVISCALLFCSCGATMLRVRVEAPSEVPLWTATTVWVARSALPEEDELLSALADRLSRGADVTVHRAGPDDVDAILGGRQAQGRVGLLVQLLLRVEVEPESVWATTEEPECGPLGCVDERRTQLLSAVQVTGHARLIVHDVASGRRVQERELLRRVVDEEPTRAERVVLNQLSEELGRWVSRRGEWLEIDFSEVDHPHARAAYDAASAGNWLAARRWLLAMRRADGSMPGARQEQGRLWINLAYAIALSPGGLEGEHVRETERRVLGALERAARLRGARAVEYARRTIMRYLRREGLRRAQLRAVETNAVTPVEAPPSYQ